jgi:hypothetical protein
MVKLPLDEMTREEKLLAFEALWADLTRNDQEFESPAWHARELEETEKRYASGLEKSIDWEDVKASIRARYK